MKLVVFKSYRLEPMHTTSASISEAQELKSVLQIYCSFLVSLYFMWHFCLRYQGYPLKLPSIVSAMCEHSFSRHAGSQRVVKGTWLNFKNRFHTCCCTCLFTNTYNFRKTYYKIFINYNQWWQTIVHMLQWPGYIIENSKGFPIIDYNIYLVLGLWMRNHTELSSWYMDIN